MSDKKDYELIVSNDNSEVIIQNVTGKVTMSKHAFVELFLEAWERRIVTDTTFSKAEMEKEREG